MKKFIFISMVCVTSHYYVIAQNTKFGFTAGASLANYKIKAAGASITAESKIGITAGMIADIPINKSFSFQPAVNYVQKGTKSEEDWGGGITVKSSTTVNCIEVPLNFLYNVHGKGGNFFIGAGPSFTYSISGNDKYDDGSSSTNEKIKFGDSDDDDMKAFDLGANFLTGYCFKNGLLISVNYNTGLSNLVPGESDGYSVKSSYFGLRLGYMLKGAGKK